MNDPDDFHVRERPQAFYDCDKRCLKWVAAFTVVWSGLVMLLSRCHGG